MKEICPNLHNKEVAKEFGELQDLFGEETAHLLWSRNNGYSIDKAPNGADSILFGELLNVANGDRTQALILKAKVYSDNFLNWFGDWTSDNKVILLANVIWGHPGTGKTWMFKQGRTDIIDFDSEYKSRLGNLQLRAELKKQIGKKEYNSKLDLLFDLAVKDARDTGKKLLVSDMHFLRDRSNDLDLITNISDEEFIKRSHLRGEHDEADKMDWKNSINLAMKSVPELKILNTTGYISLLLDRANVSKIVDNNGEPKIVYHYTTEKFNTFDLKFFGLSDQGDLGEGFYVTPTSPKDDEEKHFNYFTQGYGNITMPLFANMKNPVTKEFLKKNNIYWFTRKKKPYKSYKEHINHLIELKKYEIDDINYKLFGNDPDYSSYREVGSIQNKMTMFRLLDLKEELLLLLLLLLTIKQDRDLNELYNSNIDKLEKYDGVINGDFEILIPSPNLLKSVFNNGDFSNLNDDVYASPESSNHKMALLTARPYLKDSTPYLKSQYTSKAFRLELLARLRQYDPQLYIKPNGKGLWYIGRSRTMLDKFIKKPDKLGFVSKKEVFSYLLKQVKGSKELTMVLEILKKAETGLNHIQFKFAYLEPGTAAQFNPNTNCIEINISKKILFRNNSGIDNYLAQTILHELVHYFSYNTLHNSSELRNEAERLRLYIIRKLGKNANEYGLTDIYEMLAELTNVDFVNKLRSVEASKQTSILSKVKTFLGHIFGAIFKDEETSYELALSVLLKSVQPDDAGVNVDYIQDEQSGVMKSISASQDKIDLIHKEITKLYQDLYKNYKKLLNKGTNKQKREDSLWSTIKDLLAKDKKEASSIAIQQAFEQIGIYNLDPTIGVIPTRRDTVLGYLQELAITNFDNVTPGQIFDMKSNIINFYNDLCKYLFDDKNSLDVQDLLNIEKLSSTVHEVNRLWREAAKVVGDKIVEENVDKYINTNKEEADEIKEVAKDWLHNNDMWGDEGKFTKFFNYSRNDSPIIRQAFLMIQDADLETRRQSLAVQQRLVRAYNKATDLVDKAQLGNWLTELMERDRDGNFTGLFRSAVNRGLYKKDLEEFTEKLNEKFDKQYGYHYIVDTITGETLRSDTNASVENEIWVGDTAPSYVEYSKEMENWICDHAHRRYSRLYYNERLSKPYDVTTGKGHGLSPRTLSRQKYIQDQLNYILQKCVDEKTGLSYPERLSPADYGKLLMWRDALQDLGNPFDMYGNRKSGEELQTALEIQAWNNWLAELTLYDTDFDAYDAEYLTIQDAITRGEKTQSDLFKFVDANSEWGLNPEFLEYVFGNNKSQKDYVTRMFLNSIKRLVKTKNGYIKDFSDVIFNNNPDGTVSVPDMWGYTRLADIKNNAEASQLGIDPDEFLNNFDVREVPYTDPSGMYTAKDGVTKFDPNNNPHGLAPMTWFDYILKQYTDAAVDGRMDRFVAIDGSVAIDFSTFGGNRSKIEQWIAENILMYEKTWEDKSGNMKSKLVPLSIFNQLIPKVATFGPHNKPTSRFIPRGRFTTKSSATNNGIFDPEFSNDDRSGVQPDFGKYGDQEFVNMIQKGGAKAEYYKLLLDTMELQWNKLGLDPSYNRYKLPLIEGTSSMKRSRAAKHPGKYIKNKVQNAVSTTSDDTTMRGSDDYVMRNGKWTLKTAPTRYINEMEDPSMISSDLAFTVGLFVLMTNNYLNKQKLQAKLETLGYSLDAENRDINHQDTGTRLFERYEKMMRSLFYELRETDEKLGEKPSKTEIAAAKAARIARGGTAYLMLAYNMPSMFTGVWDSFSQMPAAAARNDQFGFKDLGYSMIVTFPALFLALANIGNPIANCKAVAMMQKDGLVKTHDETFKNSYQSRLRRALALSATGGYTMGDYMMNMLSLRCTYNAKKYYPGNSLVKEGFYTKTEFKRLMANSGLTNKELNREWKENHGESLWSAYYYENGVAKLKDKYTNVKVQDSKLSATIQLNMALLNGNAPKNDQSAVSNNILHKFFFLMRNFFIRRAEHWFAGYKPDNVARRFEETTEETRRGSSTFLRRVRKKLPLTQELKSRRLMYDYSTGEANPAVIVNLLRGALSLLAIFNQMMFHESERLTDPRKVNPNEAKALREFVTWGLCLALLSVGWMMFHRYVQDETDDLKPDNYEGSLPTLHNFIQQKVYLKLIDLVMFRVIDSLFLIWNPMQFVDMVKSATTVTSAVEKMGTIPSVGLDLIGASGHDWDEIIMSDSKYKYFPRWQRALMAGTPLNNIQTWGSWRGNDKVGRWYFDNTVTGTVFKGGGYTWKDNKEEKARAAQNSEFDIPDIDIPDIDVPDVDF